MKLCRGYADVVTGGLPRSLVGTVLAPKAVMARDKAPLAATRVPPPLPLSTVIAQLVLSHCANHSCHNLQIKGELLRRASTSSAGASFSNGDDVEGSEEGTLHYSMCHQNSSLKLHKSS